MATLIDMPKLSDTMTMGTLVKWLKNEGDPVASGDMIAEVETDKATMEVECFDDGVLIKQYCGVGDEVAVGGAIAAVGEAGEEAPAAEINTAATATPKREPAPLAEVSTPAPAAPGPALEVVTKPVAAASTTGSRIKASPLAKKIAAEKGIDLATIHGSGPSGRIVKADVENAQASLATPAVAQAVSPEPVEPVEKLEAMEIPVNGAPLAALRKELNSKLANLPPEHGGTKFSINDLTLKAAAEAVRRVPAINRSWEGETIQQHPNVHLAFGVAIEDGLVTPVIRSAETKGLREIGAEAKALIKKARGKKLTPNEMSGSTLTVTNLGMFGISDFYGIINPNNAAILSIGATIKKPVVNENDEIVIGQAMKIGLSGDHRTIDGAVGAQYLQAFKEILESPSIMLV